MKKGLDDLKKRIARFKDSDFKKHPNFGEFKKRVKVVLTAGGEGNRFKSVTGDLPVNKCVYVLPTGESMIERTIKMYKELGLKDFLILAFHHHDSVVNLLGNGEKYGVNIDYSFDPGKPVGRGGAIKNALLNKKIKEDEYLIVHNPDDQIVGDYFAVLESVIHNHLHHEEKGALASVVVVEGAPFAYSGMKVEDNLITDIEMYPFIPVPTHIGMTIFSPGIAEYFHKFFDLDKKTDFESVLFPALKEEKKLYACRIPVDSWVPVNDEKGLKKLLEKILE